MDAHRRFESMALPHMEAAYNLAYWLLRNELDAEDVVQEAYLRAYRAFDTLTGTDIRPWLFAIVRNTAYQFLTIRKRRANVVSIEDAFAPRDGSEREIREPASNEQSAEDILVSRSEQAMVHAALAKLPHVFREVIILREWEELSYHGIAEVVGVPVGTVMSRLARARELLCKHLTQLVAAESTNAL
jgi:RNA polymerase sigma-70 factor (ECF subfamily)